MDKWSIKFIQSSRYSLDERKHLCQYINFTNEANERERATTSFVKITIKNRSFFSHPIINRLKSWSDSFWLQEELLDEIYGQQRNKRDCLFIVHQYVTYYDQLRSDKKIRLAEFTESPSIFDREKKCRSVIDTGKFVRSLFIFAYMLPQTVAANQAVTIFGKHDWIL